MIKRFCFNCHKLKLIVISFFRDREGPKQPVSNQRLREGATQFARSGGSSDNPHRKSLCSCQGTSRGECLLLGLYVLQFILDEDEKEKLSLSILCRILSLKNIK